MISRILWRSIVRCGILIVGVTSLSAPSARALPPEKLPKPMDIRIDPEPTGSVQDKQRPSPQQGGNSSPWVEGSIVNILADQSPLEDILQEFGSQMNIRVFTSPGVAGKVSGRFMGLTPQKFLDQLSRAYGLDWLYYNQQIYFSSSSESQTVVRTLRYLPGDQAVKVVEQMGLFGAGASIRGIPGTPLVMLTGPPKFLDIAQEVLRTLEAQTAYRQTSELVIQVFPINYAWAYDVQMAGGPGFGGGSDGYTVQGIATTLSQLVGGGGPGISMGRFTPPSGAKPVVSVLEKAGVQRQVARAFPPDRQSAHDYPSFQQNVAGVSGANPQEANNNQQNRGGGLSYPGSSGGISILADVRSNSVIIRDVRENMGFYQAAISKLDVPVKIVEISASIIDADINSGRVLGANGITIAPLGPLASFTINNTGGDTKTGNLSLSGIYGTAQISAALNFLEKNNRAKTLSRPTIVTLDNFSASISDNTTDYVSTKGVYGTLFQISSGLSLQVVPHITMDRGQPQVSMQITISEGKSDRQGENPTTKATTVLTQAVVRMNQSLLIGGIYRKVSSRERSGYPWLSQIPVVNFLFSASSRSKGVVERLFLITPRVVDIYSKNLGDYSQYFRPSPTVEAAEQKTRDAQMLPSSPGAPVMIPAHGRHAKKSDDED